MPRIVTRLSPENVLRLGGMFNFHYNIFLDEKRLRYCVKILKPQQLHYPIDCYLETTQESVCMFILQQTGAESEEDCIPKEVMTFAEKYKNQIIPNMKAQTLINYEGDYYVVGHE
jgi:hypothetical protein